MKLMHGSEYKFDKQWTERLLRWYDGNKRNLPWRENKDPYRIWVSEVMSQQTRLEAVIPYYESWMEKFPTPHSLAEADTDEVVRAWQGLGYYSRARNLQLGVREVVERYGGQVPQSRKEVEALKGVGPYTAGAILSIAYNQRETAIDGNVLRVYARLYDIHCDILSTSGKKEITKLVEETLPGNRPGDFNEALMDFGATVCIPKTPHCKDCPLQKDCLAYERQTTTRLPIRVTKKSTPVIAVTVGLLHCGNYYLLHRRPDEGLLRSMWEFPSLEVDQKETTTSKSKKSVLKNRVSSQVASNQLKGLMKKSGISKFFILEPLEAENTTTLTHIFSHRRWEMTAFLGQLKVVTQNLPKKENSSFLLDSIDNQNQDSMVINENIVEIINSLLPAEWLLLEKDKFSSLPWAGPHGKLTVYCESHI